MKCLHSTISTVVPKSSQGSKYQIPLQGKDCHIVTQIRLNSKEGSTENTEFKELAASTKAETWVAHSAVSYLQSPGQQIQNTEIQQITSARTQVAGGRRPGLLSGQ